MENVVKSGQLECLVRGVGASPSNLQWQKRFYVLYGASANNKGRLDYYENEEAYKNEPKVRKTIYLEEVRQSQRESENDRKHTFQLVMCRTTIRTYRFAASSAQEMSEWLGAIAIAQKNDLYHQPPPVDEPSRVLVDHNAIYESAEDFQQYIVEVQETEAARRCHLKIGTPYDLFVLSECLCLADKNKRILSWSYKHIRRYGCGENNFTFEAGRKSLSGEGLFSFLVTRGDQLFHNVQDRMKYMQKKQNPEKDEFNKLLMGSGEAPTLPVRNNAQGELSPEPNTVKNLAYGPSETNSEPPIPPVRRCSAESDSGIGSLPLSKPKVPPKLPVLPKTKPSDNKMANGDKPTEKIVTRAVASSSFHSELNSKLAKPPPMLKPRSQGNPPVTERSASLGSPSRPMLPTAATKRVVSTGENYELAKSNLPSSETRKPLPNYCETTEERVLDPNYSENKLNAQQSFEEPEYAEYDICGSLRYQAQSKSTKSEEPFYDEMGAYCEAALPQAGDAWKKCGSNGSEADSDQTPPIYDTPADAEMPTTETPKMSAILARLNRMKAKPQDSEYDYIGQHPPNAPVRAAGYYDHIVNRP